jgi:DNA-binding winged helix-turn-helix (wHTH) protein
MRPEEAHNDPIETTRNAPHLAMSYEGIAFGRIRVLQKRREVLVDGEPATLGARAIDLLLALIEARGRLLSKDELLDRVWPNVVVEENNLQVQISALRKALGDEGGRIKTEFGRGYRFVGDVSFIHAENPAPSGWTSPLPGGPSPRRGFSERESRIGELERLTVDQLLRLVVPAVLAVLSELGAEQPKPKALPRSERL